MNPNTFNPVLGADSPFVVVRSSSSLIVSRNRDRARWLRDPLICFTGSSARLIGAVGNEF